MTEFNSFDHFTKKCHEILYLWNKHYYPQGKPPPPYYFDFFYELYKLWDSGKLPELTKEPIVEEVVFQMELYKTLPQSQITADGTLFDKDKSKTKL